VRNTTWTALREAALKVRFAGVLFYDGQAFMVPAKSSVKTIAALKGATVCVEARTTSAQHLVEFTAEHGLGIKPLVIDSAIEVADAFFAGRCRAYTADASQLAAARLRAPGGAAGYAILPERISREPLGPVVLQGDEDWYTLVRWALYALIRAEEVGITRANARERLRSPELRYGLGATEEFGGLIGADRRWLERMVQSVGNYGEMYERNLGKDSALPIERGLNRLSTQGGLMYGPPMR